MNVQNTSTTPRQVAQQKYDSARSNLLLMLILTVVNIVLLFTGSSTMMLFSATIPYFALTIGIFMEDAAVLTMCGIIAAVPIILYLLSWIFSKKQYAWMVTALVLFIIDTAVMIFMYVSAQEFSSAMLDILIHVWVLYYLILGVANGKKLKTLPEDTKTFDADAANAGSPWDATAESAPAGIDADGYSFDSPILRTADTATKSRILLEADANGRHVVYRRVKRTNELVIDGYVYADIEMLVESAHALTATLDGHVFEVGYDGASHSYLRVDGQTVERKMRLW